jgi:hypothetical protein
MQSAQGWATRNVPGAIDGPRDRRIFYLCRWKGASGLYLRQIRICRHRTHGVGFPRRGDDRRLWDPDGRNCLVVLPPATKRLVEPLGSSSRLVRLFPTPSGSGTDNTRARISDTLHSAANTTGFNHLDEAGGLDTAWELDIFGKLRREIEAAHLDALAAAKARDAVLVSVIADVARAYIDLRGIQAQIAVARRNIESARRRRDFVQNRFNQGLTNELDVTLAQRQLAAFEAGLGPLTGQLQSSQYVIAVLLEIGADGASRKTCGSPASNQASNYPRRK